jgi:hypothetical protein
MAGPIVGLGTVVEFATVLSPAIFTSITDVEDVKFSGDKTSISKTTNMLSTNGVDTKLSGTQDPGTCDVKCFYVPGDASQIALEAIRLSGAAVNFKVLYPLSLGSASFSGIVESMTKAFPLDKPATLDVKIAISGPITIV